MLISIMSIMQAYLVIWQMQVALPLFFPLMCRRGGKLVNTMTIPKLFEVRSFTFIHSSELEAHSASP